MATLQRLNITPGPIFHQAAIDWISDCEWGDMDQEDIDELSGVQAYRAIRRFYSGGVLQFIDDNDLTGWGE